MIKRTVVTLNKALVVSDLRSETKGSRFCASYVQR